MASVVLLQPRLPEPMARNDIRLWSAVAAEVEAIADRVARRARARSLGEVSCALGRHTASELYACAAELRANIALLESVRG